MDDRQLIADLLSALEYHTEQTRPIEFSKVAIEAAREYLRKPAQQVVDSNEKAGAYMDARLWEFIDMAAAWPKASPDPRTWDHVMVYAPKPAQQEPVAVVSGYYGGQCVILPIDPARIYNSNTPLYIAPQPCPTCEALARTVMLDQTSHDAQRTWVGLTDEEQTQVAWSCGAMSVDWLDFTRAIEAKLKEKNT